MPDRKLANSRIILLYTVLGKWQIYPIFADIDVSINHYYTGPLLRGRQQGMPLSNTAPPFSMQSTTSTKSCSESWKDECRMTLARDIDLAKFGRDKSP